MSGNNFFANLREDEDELEEVLHDPKIVIPASPNEVIKSLTKSKSTSNINVTITIYKEINDKIENIMKEVTEKSGKKITKSKVIAKICEEYLANYEVK